MPGRRRGGLRCDAPYIHRAAVTCVVIGLIAPDARRIAVFLICTNRQRIPREGYRIAEPVIHLSIGGLQIGFLEPVAVDSEGIGACIGGIVRAKGTSRVSPR